MSNAQPRITRHTVMSHAMDAAFALLVVVLATGVFWADRATLALLIEFFYFLALAQLWNLLAGYAGIVSLGQQVFIGIGGYTLLSVLQFFGVHPLVGFLVSGIAGALFAIPIGLLIFRLKGAYLAVGTWVVAETIALAVSQFRSLGAGSGISLPLDAARKLAMPPLDRLRVIYLLALVLAAVVSAGVCMLLRSNAGLALKAIRDDERAAQASGVRSNHLKFAIYIAVAAATAWIGALIYLFKFRISPGAAFDINWTSYVLFIVVIGGIGTLEGPLIGAILFFALRTYFSDFGGWYLIGLGALAVVVMLKLPAGLWGTLAQRFGWELFPTRLRLER